MKHIDDHDNLTVQPDMKEAYLIHKYITMALMTVKLERPERFTRSYPISSFTVKKQKLFH
jgi:hypothetical protein